MKQNTLKHKRTIASSDFCPGTARRDKIEQLLPDMRMTVHKFTARQRPTRRQDIAIFPLFSEFGSETLAPVYCIPKLMQQRYRGKYSVVAGWYGRAHLYKHLVDEFWELGEEHQTLREYCRAFHHSSRNLDILTKKIGKAGTVVPIGEISNVAVYPILTSCPVTVNNFLCKGQMVSDDTEQICTKCGVTFPAAGLFSNVQKAKKSAVWLPEPSAEKLAYVERFLSPRSVGITVRSRKCYGRNLPASFYESLIALLKQIGYSPVWLGEKATTLECPCPDVLDFSRMPEANDLELTMALVSKLELTIQFWTASTRLAGLVGTPFLLFESPDQLWDKGQEGYRLNLCSKGPKKIVAAHYLNVLNNPAYALEVVAQALEQMYNKDYSIMVGQVEDPKKVEELILTNNCRVGFC